MLGLSKCIVFLTLTRIYSVSSIAGGEFATHVDGAQGIVLISTGYNASAAVPYCSGALIGTELVLTHGTCCHDPLQHYTIYAGSTTPFEGGQFFKPISYQIVGDHCSKLCVMRLDREITITPQCFPLALPSQGTRHFMESVSQFLLAFGYGSTDLEPPEDPEKLAVLPLDYTRALSTSLMYLEMPLLHITACDVFYFTCPNATVNLFCLGRTHDRMRRLMHDDHGAPVVGSRDRVVYAIMNTYQSFKQKADKKEMPTSWKDDSFPLLGIDVLSAKKQILLAMHNLLSGKPTEEAEDR